MRVLAPGKLVLTGAYAVLEGAPAVVVAVDRYATADSSTPDSVDSSALHDEQGRKLGLGSSAASLVARRAAHAVVRGADLRSATVREALFLEARASHARSQGGGSGVDVAASVHGGALVYSLQGDDARIQPVHLPGGVRLAAFWSGHSARTSELLTRVAAVRASRHDALAGLSGVASRAAAAVEVSDSAAFVAAARDFGAGLESLGRLADAPIVLPSFAQLARYAAEEGGAFLPSGAGGGDVAVWLGVTEPSAIFLDLAGALGLRRIHLAIDTAGVHLDSPSP